MFTIDNIIVHTGYRPQSLEIFGKARAYAGISGAMAEYKCDDAVLEA